MFLHELGDEEDSYTRQDLSSMNSISSQMSMTSSNASQRAAPAAAASRSASRQQVHQSPAPQAAQPMLRSSSKEDSENGDSSALPSSANWARNPQVRSRRGSHATSGAGPSPAISNALPVTAESPQEAVEEESPVEPPPPPAEPPVESPASKSPDASPIWKPKSIPKDTLAALLKALNGCSLAWPTVQDGESLDSVHPPYFDVRGGHKRRMMREDEEAGLDNQSQQSVDAREPSEGEPESSGSLALGGEPEDRDPARDGHAYDMRRGSQPPIQRGNNEGLFGPALNNNPAFNQNAANLGSIGSRTVTPAHQPAFMRPQAAFADHLAPPGISQSNLFQGQGQGHNRQGSRFNFASDNATSASVKLAANPRIMAQQSSMMPSSFHNQPNSQYYASSMPGPPPGLKSTGTPPSMFGQHGFGTAFGGASKDSNDIMQLLRPRVAGSQAHDAGKLDLADPSILQARMQNQQHLQQQSNAGLGQGLFGGQSQGGYNNPAMMYNPSASGFQQQQRWEMR